MGRCRLRSRIENRRNFEEKGWAGCPVYFLTQRSRNQTGFGFYRRQRRKQRETTFPLITRISADWMLQNPRRSAKSAGKSVAELLSIVRRICGLGWAPRHSHTVVPLAPRAAGRIGQPRDLEADVG